MSRKTDYYVQHLEAGICNDSFLLGQYPLVRVGTYNFPFLSKY